MAEITALRQYKGRKKRVQVFLDGKFVFSLEAEVVAKEALRVGQELSQSRVEQLLQSDRFYRCLNAAHQYLSYRPRSEAEVRGRLTRRGFDALTIETVLARLKEQGLVDDEAFVQFWKENRQTFSPRSQRLTRLELRQKGVPGEVIDQVLGDFDDEDSACRAALSKAERLRTGDYQTFLKRLGSYLRRRGFSYGVINNTVKRLWQEGQDTSIEEVGNEDR